MLTEERVSSPNEKIRIEVILPPKFMKTVTDEVAHLEFSTEYDYTLLYDIARDYEYLCNECGHRSYEYAYGNDVKRREALGLSPIPELYSKVGETEKYDPYDCFHYHADACPVCGSEDLRRVVLMSRNLADRKLADKITTGTLTLFGVADHLFSKRYFDLSEYSTIHSGRCYIVTTTVSTPYNLTTIEFIMEENGLTEQV
jgi:hypothetical protein